MVTQQEVIKKFVKSLDDSSTYGTAALNEAVVYASSGLYSSWNDLITAFVNDVSLHGGGGSSDSNVLDNKTHSFLKEYCGIDLTNTDTGAITGYDAGGSTVQISAEDIVPESTTTTATYPTESQTTYNGVTIVWPDASELTDKEKEIVSALYSWWLQPALDLVEKSIGISFNEKDVKNRTLTITFDRSSGGTVLASADLYDITIYSQAFESIDITGGENSGKRTRGFYFDRILAHELTHAVMANNENSSLWSNTPLCVDEGIAELVHGADDGRAGTIVRLAQAVNASKLEKAMSYMRGSTENVTDAYAGGYMLFRYFAKQVSDKVFDGTAIVDLSKAGTSTGSYKVTSKNTGNVNATFSSASAGSGEVVVGKVTSAGKYTATYGTNQVITALNSSRAWNITGSEGDDTITGSSGDDTFTGGNGEDIFISTAGDDIITDYTEYEDIISIVGGVKSSYLQNGTDVVLKFDGGSIKVIDGAGKYIAVNDNAEIYGIVKGAKYNISGTVVTLSSDFEGTLKTGEYYSTVKTITAAEHVKAISIEGNGNDNSIVGGDGDDTLNGGKGNDTLTGGAGADVFIYANGGGNDVITDYVESVDVLKLTSGVIKSSSIDGSDVILNVGSGNVKIINGKDKNITVIDSLGKRTSEIYKDTTKLMIDDDDANNVTVKNAVELINASSRTSAVRIRGNANANTIEGGSSKDTILGAGGNDVIKGNAGNDRIYGDSGNDTIFGGKGNDTLTGGSGNDVFVYAYGDGNDVITDYTAGKDKIKITNGLIKDASLKGSNVVLNIVSNTGTAGGSITIKNGKNKAITVIDIAGNVSSKVYPCSSTLTVTNATTTTIIADSTQRVIDATKRTKTIKINGTLLADTIKGGSNADTIYGSAGNDYILGNAGDDSISGGADADTLIGGKGNDTLIGGTGADTFIYASGDGNDVIKDYTAGQDKIKLTSGTITNSSIKGSDVMLKIGSGSLTLKNAKGKAITITDANNKTTTKVYSNTTSKFNDSEWWFLEDTEDYSATSDLTSILNDEQQISLIEQHINTTSLLNIKNLQMLTSAGTRAKDYK